MLSALEVDLGTEMTRRLGKTLVISCISVSSGSMGLGVLYTLLRGGGQHEKDLDDRPAAHMLNTILSLG